MALGLITDPAEAEGILARDDADLIALGRPLVTDPAWPMKAFAAREAQIRYCVSCNTCWGTIVENKPLACDNNPRVAETDEVDYWPRPVANKKRLVVAGGGIAGLEAAWVAAARGHTVTLFSASRELGGSTRLHALLPGGEHLSSIYDYQQLAAKRAGVRFELGVTATCAELLSLAPDEVWLATGADLSWPTCLPQSLAADGAITDARSLVRMLADTPGEIGGRALIFDMDGTEGTYAAAEYLKSRVDEVVVLTPRERIAQDVPLVTQLRIWRRFNQQRIRILPFHELVGHSAWEDGRVSCRNVYNGDETVFENVTCVSYATARQPRLELEAPLRTAGMSVKRIGDCLMPRSVLAATAEGHAAALKL
jgi:NADPH-dependent glutamate synthase beta subunit-like oxidoreductase